MSGRDSEGTAHADRDGQFRYLHDLAEQFVAAGDPVISVDTKAKEMVGANGHRVRAWKAELVQLAAETRLMITVCHYPPGTWRWNRIEHRMFTSSGRCRESCRRFAGFAGTWRPVSCCPTAAARSWGSSARAVAVGALSIVWLPLLDTIEMIEDLASPLVARLLRHRNPGHVLVKAELLDGACCLVGLSVIALTPLDSHLVLVAYCWRSR